MTVLKEVESLIETRLEEIRTEEARLSAALKSLRGEDSSPKSAPSRPKTNKSKGQRKEKVKVNDTTPRKTVADMIEEVMRKEPAKAFTAAQIADKVSRTKKHVGLTLKKDKRFMFIGEVQPTEFASGRAAHLYMLEEEFDKLPEEVQEKYTIPSVQGTAPMPSKSGREEDPVVYETGAGMREPVPA